jgi:hypothetical protein
LSEDRVECGLAGANAVQQIAPGAEVLFSKQNGQCAFRVGNVGLQEFGGRCEPESLGRFLRKDAQTGQRSQHPEERRRMRPCANGQIIDRERTIGQEVSDPQLGRNIDALRMPVAADQLIQMLN